MICEYGCGQEAVHYFKRTKKWCCNKYTSRCPAIKKLISEKMNGVTPWNKNKKNIYSDETIEKMRNAKEGKYIGEDNPMYGKVGYWKGKKRPNHSKLMTGRVGPWQGKKNIKKRLTIKEWKKKYPLFAKIEEMRYDPDNENKKIIQVQCKNHNCPNSKEQDGWFTPTRTQFQERLRNIEINGLDNSYFYCSEKCKNECPLFRLNTAYELNKHNKKIKIYTQKEYEIFREHVLNRDAYTCQYCGKEAHHVHHERPQKLEPFFALDPDVAFAVCEKCHYKYGHKDECSTGKLANIICKGNNK